MSAHNQNMIFNKYISRLQTDFILIDHGLCPDWSRGEHTRRRDTVYLILDGQGKITIDGETIYPEKGDLVLLPKGARVTLYSENETCYNKYWCDFYMHIDGVSLFNTIDFPYMVKAGDMGYVTELFRELDELHLKTDAASALKIKSLLLDLVSLFLRNDTGAVPKSKRGNKFAADVNRFIYDNIASDLSVKILASKMGFNEKYFISVFSRNFGITPAQYVKSVRLEKAKNELLYTDLKITSIADVIGYSGAQKLSKDFKAYTGMTPSAFRKCFK